MKNLYNNIYLIKNKLSYFIAYSKNLYYYLTSFSFIKNIKYNNSNIKNIVIIKDGALGDTIIIKDFILNIIKHFNTSKIILAINIKYKLFFEDLKIKIIDINDITKVKSADIIFDLTPKKETFNKLKTLNPKIILCRSPIVASDQLFKGFTKILKPKNNGHITDYNNQLLKELNIPTKENIKYKSYKENKQIIIHVGGATKIKYLPKRIVKDMIKYFISKKYIINLTYGTPDELNYINNIKKEFKYKIIIKKHTLNSLNNLIKKSKLIISSDTGIAHMAGVLNKNLIVIYSTGDYKKWKPYGNNTKILYYSKCNGCGHYQNFKCTHECLNKLRLYDIIKKVNEFKIKW